MKSMSSSVLSTSLFYLSVSLADVRQKIELFQILENSALVDAYRLQASELESAISFLSQNVGGF